MRGKATTFDIGKVQAYQYASANSGMNANEKRSRLEDIKRDNETRNLTLREYHEALQLCEDLGLDTAWRNFKRELEYRIEQAKRDAKLGIPRVDRIEQAAKVAPVVEEVPAELVSRPAEIKTVSFEMGGKQYRTVSSWSLLD